MEPFLSDGRREFGNQKLFVEKALHGLPDEAFFGQPGPAVNPIALIVKHIAGNLKSRWTDFLTTDGEKPDRNRDGEFLLEESDGRGSLMAAWETGWAILFETLGQLTEADLTRTVTIRGEPLTVQQALLRSLTHTAYHVGQVVYLARLHDPARPWLTIPPGGSAAYRPPTNT